MHFHRIAHLPDFERDRHCERAVDLDDDSFASKRLESGRAGFNR